MPVVGSVEECALPAVSRSVRVARVVQAGAGITVQTVVAKPPPVTLPARARPPAGANGGMKGGARSIWRSASLLGVKYKQLVCVVWHTKYEKT